MKLNKYLNDVDAYVINLEHRTEKLNYIDNHLKSKNIQFKLFKALKHDNPKRGCLESHLSVIKKALESKVKYVLIMEDDCKFIGDLNSMKPLPQNWDMIYL